MINTKTVIKNKLKAFLIDLKKFKVQTVLFLYYDKRNNCQTFRSSTKLIVSDSDIDKAFVSMDRSIMIKKYVSKDWIALDAIINHSIKIFECYYK